MEKPRGKGRMMGWFERQRHKEEADKGAGLHLPESDFEQSESKFRFLFDNMRSGVAIYQVFNNGEDFVIIDFNRAAEKLENIKREDVIGKNVVDVFPGIKEMGLLDVFRRVWKTGDAEFYQSTLYRDPIRTGWRENYVYKLPSGEIVAIYNDVTERKRAELALRMGEQRFRAIADYTYHWESWVGPTGTLFWVNPAVERITGYTVAECLKMADYPMPLIHEADRETMTDILREARKGGVGKDVEFRIRRKDGKIIWGEMAWQGIYDNKGVYQGYRASIDDITERALAQEALKASEERYSSFVQNFNGIAFRAKPDFTLIFIHGMVQDITGYTDEEFTSGKVRWEQIIHPDDMRLAYDGETKKLQTAHGVSSDKEYRIIRKDGEVRWVHHRAQNQAGEDGKVAYVQGTIYDITDRRRVEEELLKGEKKYRDLVETMSEGLGVADKDYVFTYVNRRFAEMLGYRQDEMTGHQITDFLDEQNRQIMRVQMAQRRAGKAGAYDLTWTAKDGHKVYTLISPKGLFDAQGNFQGSYGVLMDISERKQAEEKLRSEEKKYHEIVDSLGEGIGISDENYVWTYVNKRFAAMLGYGQEEMIGRNVIDFMDEQNRQMMASQIAKRMRGISEPYDVAWVAKDGHKVYTLASPKGIFDEQSRFRGSFGVLVDITERKKIEDERESLLKAIEQKNKELESILYVASHDLKSAILSIESLSNDLKDSCALVKLVLGNKFEQLDEKSRNVLDRDIPETVKSIFSSVRRMNALLSGLLRLSHAGSAALNVERLDMNKILAEIIENFKQQVAEKKVLVEIEELPDCVGDASQIKEVFSNLLDNALKYLDDSRRGAVRVWGKVEEGRSVYCVEDNGVGIAREHYEKIFNMFYQLEHGKKRGEGLGLTIVRRILERNNGRVWVASEGGKGSRFYVSLPQK